MQQDSTYTLAWKRFRRNIPALAGLFFIALAVLIALFGYLLAPDNSPDANMQIPEIALQEPGFEAELLHIPLARTPETIGWWHRMWHGTPPTARLIPVEPGTLLWQADSVSFRRFGAQGIQEKWPTPTEQVLEHRHFPLGTDKFGRCIFSRLLLGFRISLLVGGIAVIISLTIGLFMGALGGYFRGRTDDVVMLLVNTIWSIPTLLLVFAIVLALGRGIGIIFVAVGLTMWVDVARVVRGQVLSLRDLPFVEAAQSMGFRSGRIIFRHILPNLMGPVLVVVAGNFATAVLVESGLSYLGFGVQPPTPSWGTMLNENYGYALGGKPLMALAPALAIALTVLAFNLVGNGLRDAMDVKGK